MSVLERLLKIVQHVCVRKVILDCATGLC